ncbi:MAG: galactokinase [Planctomycetes bacterium]|nr:galactokinase [Planctomycetota bacterium]
MNDEHAIRAFSARFERRVPTLAVRAPGRVNLIGEHTDYNGLPVFPMAIQREVRIACAPRRDASVRVENVDARFERREFVLVPEITPFARGDWGNYAKAAAQMLVQRAGITRGADLLVEGDVPLAAGLSSSSALLVACTLALLAANEVEIERTELMELCARAERYVGTHSGGMDQAICLGGRAGHALVIDFAPVRFEAVRMPDDWRFVIADSGLKAGKSGAAREGYNARTVECRTALERLRASWKETPTTYAELVTHATTGELVGRARSVLDDVLLRRFRHVVSEGARVDAARAAMLAGDAPRFGALMNASHASLRDDYDVSCPELDELVVHARSAGAFGARLTGAGFGGCIVALVRASEAERVVHALRTRYHAPRGLEAESSVLVARAADGADVRTV